MPNCTGDYIIWIDEWFGDCVESSRELAGFVVGLFPTIIWIYAQLPQIILNFKNHSAEAVSLTYYLFCVSGDVANLFALFMNESLVTQKFTAIWGLFADGSTMCQYIYYHWIKPWWTGEPYIDPGEDEVKIPNIPVLPLLISTAAALSGDPYDKDNLFGTILGWYSGFTFVVARIPQAMKNCKRKRTTGLSLVFWISSVFANSFYGISIFLKDSSLKYVWSQMPWLLGSWGCLPIDFTILGQFVYYRLKNKKYSCQSASYNDLESQSIDASYQYQ